MKKGKFAKGAANKTLALLLSLVLIVGCVAGGTLAWLTSQTKGVENTFTPSTVDVELAESTGNTYKMIPGWEIKKDPTVTLKDGSEDSFVFVKVDVINNTVTGLTGDVLQYTIDESWTAVENVTGVYYQKVTGLAAEGNTADWTDTVIKDNKIVVNENVTKEMMGDALTNNQPKITITAYAHQLYKSAGVEFDPVDAWKNVSGT